MVLLVGYTLTAIDGLYSSPDRCFLMVNLYVFDLYVDPQICRSADILIH